MNVKVKDNLTNVNISKVQKTSSKREMTKENIASKQEIRKNERSKFNEMKIREKQLRSENEAKEKLEEAIRHIKENKDALKTMDRLSEIRDKVLTTLS